MYDAAMVAGRSSDNDAHVKLAQCIDQVCNNLPGVQFASATPTMMTDAGPPPVLRAPNVPAPVAKPAFAPQAAAIPPAPAIDNPNPAVLKPAPAPVVVVPVPAPVTIAATPAVVSAPVESRLPSPSNDSDGDAKTVKLNHTSYDVAVAGGADQVRQELREQGVTVADNASTAELIHQAYNHRVQLRTHLTGSEGRPVIGDSDLGAMERSLFRGLRVQYGDVIGAADLDHNGAIDRSDMEAIREQLQSKGVSYGDGLSTLTAYLSMLQEKSRTRE
jgi:hypothetical protein